MGPEGHNAGRCAPPLRLAAPIKTDAASENVCHRMSLTTPQTGRGLRGRDGDIQPGAKTKMMYAAVVDRPRVLRLVSVPVPVPGPAQLLVRLQGCGVCASNTPPWEGKPWFQYPMSPGALGHEGWGRVERVGAAVTEFQPGDR